MFDQYSLDLFIKVLFNITKFQILSVCVCVFLNHRYIYFFHHPQVFQLVSTLSPFDRSLSLFLYLCLNGQTNKTKKKRENLCGMSVLFIQRSEQKSKFIVGKANGDSCRGWCWCNCCGCSTCSWLVIGYISLWFNRSNNNKNKENKDLWCHKLVVYLCCVYFLQ